MSIENSRQLANTQLKVKEMEEVCARIETKPMENEHVRELTLRSLKKRINQFKEEIARFQAAVAKPR